MPSHFACIGLSHGPAGTLELIDKIATNGTRRKTPRGDYIPWIGSSGAEAWVQVNGMDVLGFIPHFGGSSRIRCQITNHVERPDHSALDASFHAWINPSAGQQGDYPLVFDTPDYYANASLALPHVGEVQLTLFPQQISVFASEAEFEASQATQEARYATRCLIPSGLFGPPPPRAEALAAGVVTSVRRLKNELTGGGFVAVGFDTLGGVYDLVLPEAPDVASLAPGHIIFGSFWVSGRIIRASTPPPLPPR